MNYQDRLKQVEDYQESIKSKKTFLYEVYKTNYKSDSCLIVLADNDDEAKHIALILQPNSIWMRVDHWGYGPRIEIKKGF